MKMNMLKYLGLSALIAFGAQQATAEDPEYYGWGLITAVGDGLVVADSVYPNYDSDYQTSSKGRSKIGVEEPGLAKSQYAPDKPSYYVYLYLAVSPLADKGAEFVGFYSDPECTQPISGCELKVKGSKPAVSGNSIVGDYYRLDLLSSSWEGTDTAPDEYCTKIYAKFTSAVQSVAKIVETGTGYETLAAAIEAVQDGQTIQLLSDVAENATFAKKGATIALDLNGFTLDGTLFNNGPYLTVGGGTITKDIYVAKEDVANSVASYGTKTAGVLTIASGTYNGTLTATAGLKLRIAGGTFTGTTEARIRRSIAPDSSYSKSGGTIVVTANETEPMGGSGTAADPYTIANLAQLLYFRDMYNGGKISGQNRGLHYKLTGDIDISNLDWEPIGTGDHPFVGEFDGDGHRIKGLFIYDYNDTVNDYSASKIYDNSSMAGFFGNAWNPDVKCEIHHVEFNGADISGGGSSAVVAGYCAGYLHDIAVTGKVSIFCREKWVGAMAGYMVGNIENCTVNADSGSKIAANSKAGSSSNYAGYAGIVGYMYCDAGITTQYRVSGCHVKNLLVQGDSIVGGIIGKSIGLTAVVSNTVENVQVEEWKADPAGAALGSRFTAQVGLITGSTTAEGHPLNEHVYLDNAAIGDKCSVKAYGDPSDVYADQLYDLWAVHKVPAATIDPQVMVGDDVYDVDGYSNTPADAQAKYAGQEVAMKLVRNSTVDITLAAGQTFTIMDGVVYSGTVSAAEGYEVTTATDDLGRLVYGVKEAATPVCRIESTGEEYATLAEAFAVVENGGTIQMIDDCDIVFDGGSYVTFGAGRTATLDLNGKTIVSAATLGDYTALIIVDGGNLTITDTADLDGDGHFTGSIIHGADPTWMYDGSGDYYGSYSSVVVQNCGNGTLTIDGGLIRNVSIGSASYAIENKSLNAAADGTTALVINDGEIVAMDEAIRVLLGFGEGSAYGSHGANSVTINGGYVEGAGYAGIWIQAGSGEEAGAAKCDLTVNGGYVCGRYYAFYDYTWGQKLFNHNYVLNDGTFDGAIWSYGANLTIKGGDYVYGGVEIYKDRYGENTIKVEDGAFAAYFAVYAGAAEADCRAVSGGLFGYDTIDFGEGDVWNLSDYVLEGYEVVANTDPATSEAYPWTVGKAASYVAAVISADGATTNKYATLQGAFDVAQENETVQLLVDIKSEMNEAFTVAADKSITFDLNGKVLSGGNDKTTGFAYLTNYGTLTLKDSSAEGTGRITSKTYPDTGNCPGYHTVLNKGTFVMESGAIEEASVKVGGGNNLKWAFRNEASQGQAVTATIRGGTIVANYNAISDYVYDDSSECTLNIEGGVIKSTGRFSVVTLQDASAAKPKFHVNISGGEFIVENKINKNDNGNAIFYCDDQTNAGADFTGCFAISGGKFNTFNKDLLVDYDTVTASSPAPTHDVGYMTGGLSKCVIPQESIADGYACIDNTDEATKKAYPWMIGVKPYVPEEGDEPIEIEVPADEGGENTEMAPITVTQEWVDKKVTGTGDDGKATSGDVMAALEKVEDNGLKGWQNYVLGIDEAEGKAPLSPNSGDPEDKDNVIITTFAKVAPPALETGVDVEFILLEGTPKLDGNGVIVDYVWTESQKLKTPVFPKKISELKPESYWKIVTHFTAKKVTVVEEPAE